MVISNVIGFLSFKYWQILFIPTGNYSGVTFSR